MATTIYKFEQDRLLVKESKAVESRYCASGVPFKIPHVRQIEEVISVTNDYERYGLLTPLSEVRTSGNNIFVVMRRGDLGDALISGFASGCVGNVAGGGTPGLSGIGARDLMSGITSGIAFLSEVTSGILPISGKVTITARVIGY